VPILPSRSREIHALVARLSSDRPAEREAAVARLTLLGPRALPGLLAALPASSSALRLGALDVLERLAEPRAQPEVLALCRDPDPAVARRALRLLPSFAGAKSVAVASRILAEGPADRRGPAAEALARLHGCGLVEALDPLLDVILDEEEDEPVRLAAFEALAEADPGALEPLLSSLAGGRGALAQAAAARRDLAEPPSERTRALIERARASGLRGDEALRVARALKAQGAGVLPAVHAALEQARRPLELGLLADVAAHFRSPASILVLSRALQRLSREPARAGALAAAAARLHLALAELDSRIALYDLRERLEARPLPAGEVLLEAAERIGDASLLPALARIHSEERALRSRSERAFAAIVGRERLRRGSARFRKLAPADRAALESLWASLPGRTRRERSPG
jgi:hypothetical protein